MNAKYVNGLPLYRISQEFLRNDIHISRQVMANWMIQCADRYLGILYDRLHRELYQFHVLQADETPVMVTKDGRPVNSKSTCGSIGLERVIQIPRSSCMNISAPGKRIIRKNS